MEASCPADGKEEHEKCQRDRPDQCDEEVAGREDDRNSYVDDLPDQPDDQAVEGVAKRDAEEPPGDRQRDPFGGEDAPNVAGAVLEEAGGAVGGSADDRGCEQAGESGGVLVGEADQETAAHGCAAAGE